MIEESLASFEATCSIEIRFLKARFILYSLIYIGMCRGYNALERSGVNLARVPAQYATRKSWKIPQGEQIVFHDLF